MSENKELIIIPDIHGRDFWKQAVKDGGERHVVFLGDYLDPYGFEGITEQEAWNNCMEIVDFKKANPNRVHLLLGNHDLGYMDIRINDCRRDRINAGRNQRFFLDNLDLFDLAHETILNGKRLLLAHPWSLVYDIFTNGYFALWAVYEVIIRKMYFKLDVYTKPSHAIDLTLPLTSDLEQKAELSGHVGTHFDVMDKTLPVAYSLLRGIIFDVSSRGSEEIGTDDIPLSMVAERMFVGFRSGIQETHPYGSMEYRKQHPTLSYELMQELMNRRVAVIGLDFAGVRRGPEHTPADQMLADNGAFVIENLCNMESVLEGSGFREVMISIVPNAKGDATGIPCRVSARTI